MAYKSKSRNRSKKRSRSRTKSKTNLPSCPPVYYCGESMNMNKDKYTNVGNGYQCFKKGMGVGRNLELEQLKKRLKEKGIIVVTKKVEKVDCIDKNGKIKKMNLYNKIN
jgi:hypothetical protein